ncbi:DUF2510 domain-containing protein [Galbitalea sp. SE-J8]|uniref:DUF2510 domain-containing protein n=1 Tax=Galbitalea sp. SE-J8 TaxID=3054952 RepID=UPI00259C7E78|nr:DUF2510 domain-containing protein [Galbitalea sp. SE-J8]MDM4761749.1 DUF2510 domain-containing protein [Galbitalea sp. SE-J8]
MSTLPPPGWYPDPAKLAPERWWSGVGWTDETRTGAPEPPAAAPAAAPAAPGTPPVPRPPWDTFGPVRPMGRHDGAAPPAPVARVVHLPPTDGTTWLLGASPLLATLAYIVLAFGLGIMIPPLPYLAALYAVTVLLAVVDASRMRAAGYASRPTPLLALATPLPYLAVRTRESRRSTGGGAGPLIAFAVTLVLSAPAFVFGAVVIVDAGGLYGWPA